MPESRSDRCLNRLYDLAECWTEVRIRCNGPESWTVGVTNRDGEAFEANDRTLEGAVASIHAGDARRAS